MPLIIDYRPVELLSQWHEAPAYRARLRRGGPSLRARLARPQQLRSSMLAVGAAAALVAPLGWDGGSLRPSAARASAPVLQPFETAGENFPGSAFYYLDSASGVLPVPSPGTTLSASLPKPLDTRLGDAAARPFGLAGTSEDHFRALQCLTSAIYYEAATEPDAGQRAVAQVVLNRVAHPQWPNSVCGVVYQGSERPGCQFSFACDGSIARAPVPMWWQRARAVAERALAGEVYAPVGLATYYHTGAVHPAWAPRMTYIGAIGAHLFYRPPGAEGAPGAFTDRYWGGEPTPAPRPRSYVAAVPDPLAQAARFVTVARPASGAAAVAPEAVSVSPSLLPESGRIRPEYQNSGRWIASPTG